MRRAAKLLPNYWQDKQEPMELCNCGEEVVTGQDDK